MRSLNFKYLLSLITILGLFLTSCTNTTEPLSENTDSGVIKKIEYTPTVDEAQAQAEGLLIESFKTTLETQAVKNLITSTSALGKSNGNSTYFYIDGWHTWRGEIDASPFGIEDSYNAEYLAKIQFQDGTHTAQPLPEGAESMLMYLKAHAALGFVGDDPSGDELWYDFQGAISPLDANPSVVNAQGEYERRWVGLYSEDGENWALTELYNKYQLVLNNVQFFYDWNADDYYLNGIVKIYTNGFKILTRFTNSRTALVEVYYNGSLVKTSQFTLPNFYEIYNIPSLDNWGFGSDFAFPAVLPLGL